MECFLGDGVITVVLVLTLSSIIAAGSSNGGKGCRLARSDEPKNIPLISIGDEKVYPLNEDKGDIGFSVGSKLTLSCAPKGSRLENFDTEEEFQCTSNGLQDSKKKKVAYKNLGCEDPLREDVEEKGSCYEGFSNVSIEFSSAAGRFPLIIICHDNLTHNTIFTRHIIQGASINASEVSNKRPSFKTGSFYKNLSPQPQKAYSQKSQKEMVKKLVRSSKLADEYIDKTRSFYLARGHMSPDGDFVYVSEQNATYYFLNAVPQWQSINNGNWKALEVAVRKLAVKIGTDLEIYSGGYDVLKLKDVDGKFVQIFLSYDGDNLVLPVPRLTWKLIHDKKGKAAVVVIIVNNPHDLGTTSEDIICKSICDQITWVKWDIYNTAKGYTYCCDVASFRRKVKFAPKITGVKLLD